MSRSVGINSTKIGGCPHGLPQGACPICSGMMGSGGGSSSSHDVRRNSGEMTWNECYAMGQMLQAQRQKTLNDKQAILQAQQNASALQNIIKFLPRIMTNFVSNFLISRPLISQVATNVVTFPAKLANTVLNALKTTLNSVAENLNKFKEGMINISDKLAAIFGEIKNALQKNISESFKNIKKKFFNLFGMVDTDLEQGDEEKEIEEEKRELGLKKIRDFIFKIGKKRKEQ